MYAYVYENKETKEVVVAIRFQHYSNYVLEKVGMMFGSYPYDFCYFTKSNGYVDQAITFIDKEGITQKVKNGDWIIFKDKNTYETLDHWSFRERYQWIEGTPQAEKFIDDLMKVKQEGEE